MMTWFDKIKYYYESGLWDIQKVKNVVGKVIDETEYTQITGFTYPSITL